MPKNFFRFFAISLMALLLATGSALAAQQTQAPDKINSQAILNPHLLRPGDILEIHVPRQEELDITVRVNNKGYIQYPFVGRIKVAGLDVNDVEDALVKGLKKARYENPQVVVFVKEYVPRMVYVFGEVHNVGTADTAIVIAPGTHLTAMQALSTAGGVTEKADLSNVMVQRTDQQGRQHKIKLNVQKIMSNETGANDVLLIPGDVVLVPSMRQVFVYGRVKKPGAFYIPHGDKLTVSRVLALAEGSERPASEEMISLIRGDKVISVDLSQMVEGGNVKADLELQPGDVIYVPQSRW